MAVKRVICIFSIVVFLATLVGCGTSKRDFGEYQEENLAVVKQMETLSLQMDTLQEELRADREKIIQENERFRVENEQLKQTIEEMKKLYKNQTKLEYIEKLQVSSEEDIKKLHN